MSRLFPLGLSACLLLLCMAVPARAGLDWQARDVELQARPADEKVQADFVFTNTSEQPVTITSVRSSCGCTTTTLEKKTYEPGEEGRITATYTLGSAAAASGGGSGGGASGGEQVKQIIVRTDDPASPIIRLTLRVKVPQLVEIQPRLLIWRAEEELAPKTVDLKIVHEEPIEVLGLQDDEVDGPFTVTLETLEEGQRYRLEVTPTGQHGSTQLPVVLKLSDGQARSVHLLARVFARPDSQPFEAQEPVVDPAASESTTSPATQPTEGDLLHSAFRLGARLACSLQRYLHAP